MNALLLSILQGSTLQEPDWRSYDSVDTAFEAAGLLMSQSIMGALFWTLVPILILSGIALVVYQALTKQDLSRILLYAAYLLVMLFLLTPTTLTEREARSGVAHAPIEAPRLLVWMNAVSDFVVGKAGAATRDRWQEAFKVQWVTRTLAMAQITSPDIKVAVHSFLDNCYVPALARSGADNVPLPSSMDLLAQDNIAAQTLYESIEYEVSDDRTVNCGELRQLLSESLDKHIHEDHGDALAGLTRHVPEDQGRIASLYKRRLVYNEMFGSTPTESLDTDFVRHTPSGLVFIDNVVDRSVGQKQPPLLTDPLGATWSAIRGGWELTKEGLGYGLSWLTKEMSPIYARYMVVMMGPVIYGMVIMILMALFPVVAMFSVWPFQTKILLNFFKVFLSVKLWVLFWVMIGRIEHSVMGGSAEELFSTHEVSASSVGLAAAAMYIVVPMLSYMVVSMATAAIAVPMVGARDSGMNEGYGTLRTTGGDAKRAAVAMGGDLKKIADPAAGAGAGARPSLPVGLRSRAPARAGVSGAA